MVDERIYFYDMLSSARKIKALTQGMSQDDFNNSEIHQLAIVRLIQIIGEAARLVSAETKAAHSDVKWRKIASMRNNLVHRYFDVNLKIVWDVVAIDLDILIPQLQTLLPPEKNAE